MNKLFIALILVVNSTVMVAEEVAISFPKEEALQIGSSVEYSQDFGDVFVAPPIFVPQKKNVFGAVTLSCLFPGLGHLYLEDYTTATSFMMTTGIEFGLSQPYQIGFSDQFQDFNRVALSNTWFYGIYAAYRDARTLNGQGDYSYRMPKEDFIDLCYAPFNPSVWTKPEVWGGLLMEIAAAVGVGYLYSLNGDSSAQVSMSVGTPSYAALPIGIGEEALFRGFFMPQCSEMTNQTGGLLLSSALFGAAHIPNAQHFEKRDRWKYYAFSLPLITGIGLYHGAIAQKNTSLKEVVALHAWYDFIIFSVAALSNEKEAVSEPKQFALSFPF